MSGMAADPSRVRFLAALGRSRLLAPAELDRLARGHPRASGREVADALVAAGALTHYQADKLVRGVWQGLALGPYRILAPLGRGGMGTVVYLARDTRRVWAGPDADLVALKLLPHRKAEADPKAFVRFRREMTLGKRVEHPRVARTLESGEVDAVHFIALEYVPGRTLRQVVLDGGPLAVGDAARVCADVAAGLDHIHARGLVHRDVKPANVMVRPDGSAVVLDLGLAYAPNEPLLNDPAVVGGRGYVVGTMDYIAPEQVRHATAVGPAADLYGLGCSLVFALTGKVPFPARTTQEKLRRHRDDPPPPLAGVPPVFRGVVYRLMAKDPSERPRSAAEARDLLAAWATAAQPRSAVDAVTLADAPHGDAGLWDAAPGEELPDAKPKWELVHDLDGESEVPEPRPRSGCAGAALLLFAALVAARVL